MKKIIKIHRFDPEKDSKPYFQEYEIDLDWGTSVLLAFHHIRENLDPSLVIRSSCRAAVCWSCSILINWKPRLWCKSLLKDFKTKTITLEPLPTYPVIKDLVIDLDQFFSDYKKLEPWLKTDKKPEDSKEYIQTIEQKNKIEPYDSCIMCWVCQWWCPSREKSSEEFMWPALMVKANRWINDSRDDNTIERLKQINLSWWEWECSQFSKCTNYCPMEIPWDKAILQIRKDLILSIMKLKEKFKN
jgi:succinate dehydrogenase/fumarate reductase iron-sulfur protein